MFVLSRAILIVEKGLERSCWYSKHGIGRCVRQDAEVVSVSCVIPLGVAVAPSYHSFLRCSSSIFRLAVQDSKKKRETIQICCSVGQNGSVIDRLNLPTEFELRHSSLAALFFPTSCQSKRSDSKMMSLIPMVGASCFNYCADEGILSS